MKFEMTLRLLAVAMTSTTTLTAHADQPMLPQLVLSSVSGTASMPTGEAEPRPAELEQAYQDTQLTRPRRGVIISSVLLAGGAGLLAGGIALSGLCFSPSQCPDRAGVGAAGLGAALIVGSIVGVTISSIRLKRTKEGRRRLQKRALP